MSVCGMPPRPPVSEVPPSTVHVAAAVTSTRVAGRRRVARSGAVPTPTSAPVMAMVWEGPNAVAAVRQTMGATRPTEAAPGSIRHDFALEVGRNLTHASDSHENAEGEVSLWFNPEELVSWGRSLDQWVFEK